MGADIRRGLWVAVIAGSALLAGVAIVWELRLSRSAVLLPVQLGTELNLATWWSGALLIVAAAAAVEAAPDEGAARRGWFALAGLLGLLSLTEIGSLHERLDGPGLLVFGLVLMGLYAVAARGHLREPEDRRALVLVTVALGILAVTTLQEHARKLVDLLDDLPLLPVAVEEIGELVAYLLILSAALHGWASRGDHDRDLVPDVTSVPGFRSVILAGLAAHVAYSWLVSPYIEVGQHGDIGVWFPALLFLVLALRLHRDGQSRRAAVAFAASAFVVSAVSPASIARLVDYGAVWLGRPTVALVLALVLVGLWRPWDRAAIAGAIALATALLVDVVVGIDALRYTIAAVIAVVPLLTSAAIPGSGGPRSTGTDARAAG